MRPGHQSSHEGPFADSSKRRLTAVRWREGEFKEKGQKVKLSRRIRITEGTRWIDVPYDRRNRPQEAYRTALS